MASEVERIGEECRRYSQRMVERMDEAQARRDARSRELAAQAVAETRQFRQAMAERAADHGRREGERPPGADEQGRQSNGLRSPAPREPTEESFRLRQSEVQRLRHEELRRQREAIVPAAEGAGVPVQQGDEGAHPAPSEEVVELDPREAIARAAAARRRNSVVAPIDDDGDNEAEYYRRKSWLV